MRLTYRNVKRVMLQKGYKFFTRIDSINIVGIRVQDSSNEFSDRICVLYIDARGREVIETFRATTKAGKHWLLNPLNSKGTAIVCEGQYLGVYKIGIHNRSRPSRSYEALEQKGIMKYFRDNDRDSEHDYTGPIYEGNYKTNIHRSGKTGWSRFVDKWSAGCQVIAGVESNGQTSWERFMYLCKLSAKKYGNSFTYTLLNERDF